MQSDKLKTSDQVLMQKVADEAVLLDLESQSYFGLDPVGTLIWESITKGESEEEIVTHITAEFDVDSDTARGDLKAFLEELREGKLVSTG